MQNLDITNLTTHRLKKVVSKVETNIMSALLGLIGFVSISQMAIASETYDAHTHGVANLALVSEAGALEIRFESPAMSLLGFEHKPSTDQHEAVIESSKSILISVEKVISIEGASCEINHVDVDIHGPAGQSRDGNKEDNHHGDEHTAGDTDDEHDEHGDEEAAHDSDETHSEILATYRFDCSENEQISSIGFSFFNEFPNLESIKVNWVTENQQGQSTLRPDSAILELK